jgi:hypothetical protein
MNKLYWISVIEDSRSLRRFGQRSFILYVVSNSIDKRGGVLEFGLSIAMYYFILIHVFMDVLMSVGRG